MDPELWEMLEEGDSEDEVAAIIRLGQPGIVPPGVRVIAQFGEIVTVRIIKRGSILDIREEAEVASFKAPGPPMGPDVELDDTELLEGLPEALQPSDERRPPSLDATGRDVVVGIVDWGLDFAHPDFRNPDGSTRILALWDQRGRPRPESPQPYGYGLVHTREEINRALAASDPYAALGYHPADADMGRGSHGTLVASIAAGNGGSGSPVGIAPEAKIVFVHLATWGQDASARLGNSVTLLEAVDFIARTAGERPWVINLSMGRTGEQHDGTTLVEQGLDAALRAAPGHVTCHSTGNYFTRRLHASGQLRPAEERTLIWEVMKADVTPNELEIWYPGRDKMEVEIRSPDGVALARLKLGERAALIANGQTVGRAYHREAEPNNLANHIDIFLYAGAPAGAWEVMLLATDVVDGRFHAWIERDAACPDCQSHFRREDADPTSTTGTICNGLRTIAVGAYNPHHPDQPVAPFSSMGPTRDGRLKPDLCAPGVAILGARSAPRDANGQAPLWTRMSGTSFAAPHVTGCVALMLQVAPRPLRIEEVHNLLLANTRKVHFPDELPGRLGSGYLDIERAVEAARNIGRIGPELKPASVAKEAAMMREDQEIEMLGFVEGKAEDDAEAEEASNWQNTFHRIADDITGAFEGGKPGTLNLYDLGIISYGKHQATLASGTLYPILKRYTELSSSETAKKMSAYLDRVKQRDETLREDKAFIQLLKDAAKEPEMNRAQDEEFARQYWEPSRKAAREAGIKSALGYVILYDTRIQGGMQQVLKQTQERLGGKVGDTIRGREITEQEFLRVFVEERVNRNLRISAHQKKQAQELNKEAQALEDAAAADPDRAPELRGQAADKRKKAKQYAANASALEISANKTRGPSLRALVDSGDLNLYGDTDGKLYLTGKSGVVITGLKPSATINSTTPAEQVEEEADEEAVTKRNFVLISGGPGPYDTRDIEHDQSWANYVTPPLLLTDTAAERKAFVEEDEEVWWFVYKPAYERRWAEDSSSSNAARKKAVKNVKDQGFSSYTDLIEARASTRGWNLRWLSDADELWKKLKTFSKNSISRVYYWGHARDDLWLAVQHDADTGAAIAPDPDEIIKISSIDSKLKNRFRKGDVDRMNRFIGCNTVKFAEAWAKTFDVWAEGVEGKVNFASIHKTGGEPCLVGSAQVKFFSPGGKEEAGQAWRAKAVKCGTISSEALPEEAEALDSAPSTGHSWEVLLPQEVAGLISFTSEAPAAAEAPETDAAELVELADQVIAERAVALAPTAVLHHVLSRAGMAEALTLPGSGRLPSAAELFDAFAYPGREALRSQLEQYFEVVALPRTPLDSKLRRSDLLIRRAEDGLGHLSVIASAELRPYGEVLSEGLIPEAFSPGKYAHVVDAGVRPHTLSDAFARRVTDDAGRLPYDQLVLRTQEHVRQRVAESMQLDESVILPALVESFSGQVYTTGWTTFMPFELNSKPHYLAYKILTGDVSIDRFRPGALEDAVTHWPVDVVHTEKWSLGWTTLLPFKLPGSARTHYLAYKVLTGDVSIDRIKPDGKGVDTIWGTSLDPSDKWTSGWTHFMPFTIDGRPHYLAYKMLTGTVAIDRIKPDGKGVETIWGTPLDSSIQWTAGWTTFMPFKFPGNSRAHYLAYRALTGDVSIGRVKADGKGVDRIWGTPLDSTIKWTSGWTEFMPFTLDGKPHYLAYKAATGEVAIDRIKPDGKGVDTIWGTPLDASLKWAPDWTTIMPFKMDDKPHYFAYNTSNGWVSVGSIAEELRRCVSPGVSRDDPTALNLSPIGTDDFNVTLTVRGTSYQVKGNVFYPGQSNGARVHFNTSAVPGGKAPIVFIAHGNHALFHNPANRLDERGTNPGGFVPILNHKGYEYFQQLLAQMGIISVSVDCNQFSGFIGSSPKNMNDRADLVLGAIKHFQSLNSGSDPTFGSHIDFSRVGLMGHSRGGEVVLLVPELLALSSTGISGVTVKGVISIAPTDVGATSGKPSGFAFMTILPAADLDVITNHGAKFYDQASADPFKCQLYIHNANHNFFNTEWVSDDLREWNPVTSSLPTLRSHINVMDKDDEKAILKENGCAFFRTVLLGHNLRKFLEGLEIPPGVARFRDIHISFERTGSTTVDDNEDHDIDCNTLGRPNSRSGGLTANEYDFVRGSADVFNNTFYGHTRGMVAQSSTASGRFRWDLVGSTDLIGREVRIRSAEVYNGASVPVGATGFKLGLVDAAAKQAFVDSDSVGGLPRPYDRRADDLALFSNDFTKTMLTTLRFPISCFAHAEPGFDPKQVRAIVLLMDRHDGRALAFDQLQIV